MKIFNILELKVMSLRIKVPIPVWIALVEFSHQSKLVLAEAPCIYMLVAGTGKY